MSIVWVSCFSHPNLPFPFASCLSVFWAVSPINRSLTVVHIVNCQRSRRGLCVYLCLSLRPHAPSSGSPLWPESLAALSLGDPMRVQRSIVGLMARDLHSCYVSIVSLHTWLRLSIQIRHSNSNATRFSTHSRATYQTTLISFHLSLALVLLLHSLCTLCTITRESYFPGRFLCFITLGSFPSTIPRALLVNWSLFLKSLDVMFTVFKNVKNRPFCHVIKQCENVFSLYTGFFLYVKLLWVW